MSGTTVQADLFCGDALAPDDGGEFLPTPDWFADPVLRQALGEYLLDVERPLTVLDAGAGTGCLGLAVEHVCPQELRPLDLVAVEQHAARLSQCPTHWQRERGDFLAWSAEMQRQGLRFDLVVTNPPFSRWREWIEACLPLVAPGGTLLAVAQLAWVGQRPEWWAERRPSTVWLSGRRPWPAAVRECCWVEWQQGGDKGDTVLRWIEECQ